MADEMTVSAPCQRKRRLSDQSALLEPTRHLISHHAHWSETVQAGHSVDGHQCIGVIRVGDEFYRTPFVCVSVIASIHAAPRVRIALAPVTLDKIRGSEQVGTRSKRVIDSMTMSAPPLE
jgi:hypothetical protein